MRYKKIIIENYKAITAPIEIDFSKKSLMPIIGVNECGKTTILNAIFAFDYINDNYDNSIHHLTDVRNLYDTTDKYATITAVIEISKTELKDILFQYFETNNLPQTYRFPKNYKNEHIELDITRKITTNSKKYSTSNKDLFSNISNIDELIRIIISHLPYILYFDDFKDSFPDKIEINEASKGNNKTWLSIIEELFYQTNEEYDVFQLSSIESRRRKSILGDVAKHLNKSLTKEWANFRLEDKAPLQIAIEYFTEEEGSQKKVASLTSEGENLITNETHTITKHYLKFEVIDKDPSGNERYFYVRDRSKGFYWFFNFVMKLEFNPKINGSDNNAIYLLDEPGSYLHSFAQGRLCKKLKDLSHKHKVIYCTHSHYLLNPQIIPLNSISIANKSEYGQISLIPYHKYNTKDNDYPTAFQTIFDALHLQPLPYELTNKFTILVEGIYDYYSFSMFTPEIDVNIIPCKGATSISQFISLMIGFKISYKALWDNDSSGKEGFNSARLFFGPNEASANFHLLPLEKNNKTRILQDLFDSKDIVMIKESLELPKNTSFEKTIAALYFNPNRSSIISQVSENTFSAFKQVYQTLGIID